MESKSFKTYIWNSYGKASNAGMMHIQFGRWLLRSGWQTWRPILFMCLWLCLSYFLPWVFLPFFFISFGGLIVYFLFLHDVFILGDVLPGVVIDEHAGLVAAGTNMLRFGGSYPVIVVIKTSLPREYRQNGIKIPIISSYGEKNEGVPYWERLVPNVVINGINNPMVIEQKINSVPKQQWQDFLLQIRQIPRPYKMGLYKVDMEKSDWEKHPDAVLDQNLVFQHNVAFSMFALIFVIGIIKKLIPGNKKQK